MLNKVATQLGFTIVEAMIVVAILALLGSFAIPAYQNYQKEIRFKTAIADMMSMEVVIKDYKLETGDYPSSLETINMDNMLDPWDRPYEYISHSASKGKGKGKSNGHVRKDKNLVPINSDFDLYSVGADGKSVGPLTASHSHDDIIRANNGSYYGLAEDY